MKTGPAEITDHGFETIETDEKKHNNVSTDELENKEEKSLILGDIPEPLRIKLLKIFIITIAFLTSAVSLLIAMRPYPIKFLLTSIVLIIVFIFTKLQDADTIIKKKYDTIVGKCLYLQSNKYIKRTKLLFFMSEDNAIYNVQISKKNYDFRPGCTVCVYTTKRSLMLNKHGSTAINQPFLVDCLRASDIMEPEETEENVALAGEN